MHTKTFLFSALFAAFAFGVTANELTVMSWGGAYAKSQVEAYHKPFTDMTGIVITSVDADNPATPIKAQVEAGNVSVDVADVEMSDALRLCDEGLLLEIDSSILPPAPDGTPAASDFVDGSIQDCAVANIVWSTIFAYNTEVVNQPPQTIADFFNVTDFTGKRGIRRSAKPNLEMALMGDGVPADQVYAVLETKKVLIAHSRNLIKLKITSFGGKLALSHHNFLQTVKFRCQRPLMDVSSTPRSVRDNHLKSFGTARFLILTSG